MEIWENFVDDPAPLPDPDASPEPPAALGVAEATVFKLPAEDRSARCTATIAASGAKLGKGVTAMGSQSTKFASKRATSATLGAP